MPRNSKDSGAHEAVPVNVVVDQNCVCEDVLNISPTYLWSTGGLWDTAKTVCTPDINSKIEKGNKTFIHECCLIHRLANKTQRSKEQQNPKVSLLCISE